MKIQKMRRAILLFSGCCIAFGAACAADRGAPLSEQHPVSNIYHNVTVSDPYRWLENTADPQVHAWSAAQDARARKYLDELPQRAPIFTQLLSQISATSSSYRGLRAVGSSVFAYYSQPPKQQPMIALLTNAADPSLARIIVDPNTMNPKGTTAIDWFVPSPDGKLLAVSMSENGSEDGTLHVFDVASGKVVGPLIPRVQYPTGGGSLEWRADAQGFWYTRYPGAEKPAAEQHFFQQVYFHKMGDDPSKDTYVIGRDFPKVAEIKLDARYNPKLIVVTVANGDGGEFAHYVIGAGGGVQQITNFDDKIVAVTADADGALYLVSRKGAPRGRLLKLAPGLTDLSRAATIIPESDAVMLASGEFGGEPVVVTPQALYLRELMGGPSRVAIFDHAGNPKGMLPLPDVAAVDEVEPLSDGTLLYSVETYLRPPHFSRYDSKTAKGSDTQLTQTSPVSFSDTEVIREFVKSKDGTSIPINIVRRKGTQLNGMNPVLLTGYGGFGVSETPGFLGADVRLWLDGGGVFVDANLRGGGEFGEDWHAQGALIRKQNVFDDFLAAAQHLIAEKYTDRNHLAILGGSNGGLLMGAALTQRPDLFRAVVSLVGIYDMLRVELDPNGLFNTTEYGSVKDPEQFTALYAYSPYHRVKDGTAYPAIFMATGETDGRVNPAHSRKMTARLQAASSSGRPILLSINAHAGHGIGSALSIRVNQQADAYAFLFDQLGMKLPQK
ncbi:MAG TPA: prolyl oligopeptidase family serine peptidase [Steroidobacteraceae bacterium]|nr:prolyl oligopeptidase family serine peptidase [Steroidobacteraceae bacterium]